MRSFKGTLSAHERGQCCDLRLMEKKVWDRFADLREKKIKEWKERGFPGKLIEKGILRADDWLQVMSRRFIERDPEIAAKYPGVLADVQRENYPKVLMDAERYMEELAEFLEIPIKKQRLETKLKEVI